jgi:hypothetical protein
MFPYLFLSYFLDLKPTMFWAKKHSHL